MMNSNRELLQVYNKNAMTKKKTFKESYGGLCRCKELIVPVSHDIPYS